jgi:hypothetical protein
MPDSFEIQGETVGAGATHLRRFMPNSMVEYSTDKRALLMDYLLN